MLFSCVESLVTEYDETLAVFHLLMCDFLSCRSVVRLPHFSLYVRHNKLPRGAHSRHFTLAETAELFVNATLVGEGSTMDLRGAGEHEMMYTIEQGINSRSLVAEDACMTLKQLFLFSCSYEWPENKRRMYWERNIKLAVGTGAGLFVSEVFDEDEKLAAEAVEWMMRFDRNQEFSPTICFMRPRTKNQPTVSGNVYDEDEREGSGGEGECSQVLIEQRPTFSTNLRGSKPLDKKSLGPLVAETNQYTSLADVLECVLAFGDTTVTSAIPPPLPSCLGVDTQILLECINILRVRNETIKYRKALPFLRKLVVVEEQGDDNGESSDEEGSEEPNDAVSVKRGTK